MSKFQKSLDSILRDNRKLKRGTSEYKRIRRQLRAINDAIRDALPCIKPCSCGIWTRCDCHNGAFNKAIYKARENLGQKVLGGTWFYR